MKSAIYSPYLDALGGGERYIMTIAEFLAQKGQVDVLWSDTSIKDTIAQRFRLDLTNVQFINDAVIKSNVWSKYQALHQYDVLFYLSDGSFPFGFAKRNIMHIQMPLEMQGRTLNNRLKLATWQQVVVNSQLTKKHIDQSFGIKSKVVYPPVDIKAFAPGRKEQIIINVGRFHGREHGKKQEFLIEAFRKMVDNGLQGWRLVLVGSVENQPYVDELKQQAQGYPIEFLENVPFAELIQAYAKATIYWHAQGYGETQALYQEHFGMTTVEAMASGCVPIVIGGGGQEEIVTTGVDGCLWKTQDELIEQTQKLINDPNLCETIAQAAIIKSQQFSKEHFAEELGKII